MCDKKNKKIYDNLVNIETELKNSTDFKSYLISFLNFNPLINYKLQKKSSKILIKK